MPMYSPNAARAKATAVVRQIVAASGRIVSDEELADLIDALAEDLGEGPVTFQPVETQTEALDDRVVVISLVPAAKAAKDET